MKCEAFLDINIQTWDDLLFQNFFKILFINSNIKSFNAPYSVARHLLSLGNA